MKLPAALLVLVAGCLEAGEGQQGGEDQAIRMWSATLCARIQTCNPAGFAQVFSDLPACMSKVVSTFPPDDLGKPSKCSASELQVCIDATAAYSCQSLSESLKPPACERC
jgi:hypothetical protein